MKSTRVRHAFAGTTRQTRLNVFDGLYPHPEEKGVMHRVAGQKLRDIVHPQTGFCVNAVTNTFNQYEPVVRPAACTSGAGAEAPRYDRVTGRWYDAETGYVLRTTADGDAPLPRTRIIKNPTSAPAKEPVVASSKVDSPRRAAHVAARQVTRTVRITDEDIRAYLVRTYGAGVKGITLTTRIRQAARAAMTHQATVKQYTQDLTRTNRTR